MLKYNIAVLANSLIMKFLTAISILAVILYYGKAQAHDQTDGQQCTGPGIPNHHLTAQTNGCVNCIGDTSDGPNSNCYEKCGKVCNTPRRTECSECVNTTQACPQQCHDYCACQVSS